MKTFIINLGLNNNPSTEQEAKDILKGGYLSPLVTFTDFVTHMGEYEGRPEPTLVMKMVVSDYNVAQDVVRKMCFKFTQECIAIRQEGAEEHAGELIWNDALTERPYTFNPDFFIDPYRKPSGKHKFPRKCSLTNMGMWEGYCFGDGQDYAINKAGALYLAIQYGYETLEEAYEDDAYYFTEWEELDEGWYESDYEDGRDAVWVDAE